MTVRAIRFLTSRDRSALIGTGGTLTATVQTRKRYALTVITATEGEFVMLQYVLDAATRPSPVACSRDSV
jgi:hypothetical protein